MLCEKNILNETKNHNPTLPQVKWSVPYGPKDSKFAYPFRLNKELSLLFVYFLVYFTYIFLIWTVTHQSLNFIFFKKHLNHSITKNQKILWKIRKSHIAKNRNWSVSKVRNIESNTGKNRNCTVSLVRNHGQ